MNSFRNLLKKRFLKKNSDFKKKTDQMIRFFAGSNMIKSQKGWAQMASSRPYTRLFYKVRFLYGVFPHAPNTNRASANNIATVRVDLVWFKLGARGKESHWHLEKLDAVPKESENRIPTGKWHRSREYHPFWDLIILEPPKSPDHLIRFDQFFF